MKTSLLSLFFAIAIVGLSFAQSPRVTADGKNISIAYGQPSKKNRLLFGSEDASSLEKYDKIWRTGANEATEITFKKDGQFGGKAIKAGTYTLFTIPGVKEWTVILNGVTGQFGAYDYDKHKDKDVLKVTVPAKKYGASEEKMTFTVQDNALNFQWDKEGFSVPTKF